MSPVCHILVRDVTCLSDLGKRCHLLTSEVNILSPHLCVHLLGLSVSDLQPPGLIVCTVRTWHQLPERSWSRKPCLQIQLLGSCIVELSRDDINHSVRDTKLLVEALRIADHFVHHLPRGVVMGTGQTKLLHLQPGGNKQNTLNTFKLFVCCFFFTKDILASKYSLKRHSEPSANVVCLFLLMSLFSFNCLSNLEN